MSTTTLEEHDRIDELFDEYRPVASDADRQAVLDRLIPELRRHHDAEPGEGLSLDDDHAMTFEELLSALESTPVSDPDHDRLIQEARTRFRAHHATA